MPKFCIRLFRIFSFSTFSSLHFQECTIILITTPILTGHLPRRRIWILSFRRHSLATILYSRLLPLLQNLTIAHGYRALPSTAFLRPCITTLHQYPLRTCFAWITTSLHHPSHTLIRSKCSPTTRFLLARTRSNLRYHQRGCQKRTPRLLQHHQLKNSRNRHRTSQNTSQVNTKKMMITTVIPIGH